MRVIDNAESRFVTSPPFWRRAVLNSVQLGSVAAQGVLDADGRTARFERFHERPNYSAAGKAPGEGPIMRFENLGVCMGTMISGDRTLTLPAIHLRQVHFH